MEIKFKYFLVYIIIGLFISCNQNNENQITSASYDTCSQIIPLNDSISEAYIIPSPLQVAYVLRIIDDDIAYQLLAEINSKTIYKNQNIKALNLGISLVDFGYINLFEQNQYRNEYISKIDFLIDELGLENQNYINYLEQIKNNPSNKELNSKLILKCQNNINDVLEEKNQKNISIIILCGVLIESQAILLNSYNGILENNIQSKFKFEQLNSLLFQQEIYLNNLIELIDGIDKRNSKSLINELNKIKVKFTELQISVNYDNVSNKIINIKLDNKHINSFYSQVLQLRKKIIYGLL